MSGSNRFDLVVLGGGPGGLDAALHGAKAGLSVALVEKDLIGGTCLNRGCIPTKLMLGATAAVDELAAQARMKIASGSVNVDWKALQTKKDRLLAGSRKATAARLNDAGAALFEGTGSLSGANTVDVAGESGTTTLEFTDLVIAVGCRPSFFPGMEPDNVHVLDSTGFLDLEEMPESLIVVGAGFIGLETAQIAHRMGAKVTIVDALDRVAPYEDPEVSKALLSIFKRQKWTIKLGVRVSSLKAEGDGVKLVLESGDEFTADKGLVAVGRRPVTDALNLGAAEIETYGPGFITTDPTLKAAKNIYAVGDVNGRIQLAHAASHQAEYVIDRITGKTDAAYASGPVPSILYGAPEVMRVGRMVEDVKKDGGIARTTKVPLAANPIAQSHAATQGFVKVVWDGESGENRIAGITAVGCGVSSLTMSSALMVRQKMSARDLRNVIFPHPTLDESLMEALRQPPENA